MKIRIASKINAAPCFFRMVCLNACDECKTREYSAECVPALQRKVLAQADTIREQDELLKILQRQHEERKNGKLYTLEEIARQLCNSRDADDCESCPAAKHCFSGHNGMLEWLREVMENEQD